MSKPKPPTDSISSRGSKIVLDWRAYFYQFCQVHGEPILSAGRLLFRDGWTYSATDYKGPEFPPPKDLRELDLLVLEYWKLRQSALGKQITKVQHELKVLKEVITSRSLPLIQSVKNAEGKLEPIPVTENVLSGLELKVQWLSDDLIECDDRLKEIRQYHIDKDKEI